MTILYMLIAIGFETGWAVAMKASDGLTRPAAAAMTIVCYLLSVVFLALAARRLELSMAYAIWAGSGVALVALSSVVLFRESLSVGKMISIGLIVAGIVGVHLCSRAPETDQGDQKSHSLADLG